MIPPPPGLQPGRHFSQKTKPMKTADLDFTDFPEANLTLRGRPLQEDERHLSTLESIRDVKAWSDGQRIITRWHCRSFLGRLRFLITGEIWLTTLHSFAPAALQVGKMFRPASEAEKNREVAQ